MTKSRNFLCLIVATRTYKSGKKPIRASFIKPPKNIFISCMFVSINNKLQGNSHHQWLFFQWRQFTARFGYNRHLTVQFYLINDELLRAIFWEDRELMHTRKKLIFFFFIFAQNIPFGKLLREKIVLFSSNLFFWAKFWKVRKMHIWGSFNASKERNNVVTLTRPFRGKNNCGLTKLLTNFTLLLFFKMM